MSHYDNGEDAMLDTALASYYGTLADIAVPVKLPGRAVRSLQERSAAPRHRRPSVRLSGAWARPLAVVAIAVAIAALVGLPWLSRAQSGIGGHGTPTAVPSGAMQITVMNLGGKSIEVTADGKTIGTVACGQSKTYTLSTFPVELKASVGSGFASRLIEGASAHQWWVYRLRGWEVGVTGAPTTETYSICPSRTQGSGVENGATWDFDYPVIKGTAADSAVNRTIQSTIRGWSIDVARGLTELRDSRGYQSAKATISGSYVTVSKPTPGWQTFAVFQKPHIDVPNGDQLPTWTGYLTVDLSDGHMVGVDELFTDPAAGLAILSAQSRELLGLPADGGSFAAATEPLAVNFAKWFPQTDGIDIVFPGSAAGVPGAVLSQREIVVPWSALEGVLKPDLPVRSVIGSAP